MSERVLSCRVPEALDSLNGFPGTLIQLPVHYLEMEGKSTAKSDDEELGADGGPQAGTAAETEG